MAIIFPMLLLCIWCFVTRWPFPQMFPEHFSLRGFEKLIKGNRDLLRVLAGSVLLSAATAVLTVIISGMAARAFVFYEFAGMKVLKFLSILPIIVPGTVFGMGIHVLFIRMGLNNTFLGVVLVHTVCALPYGVKIMTDRTQMIGRALEETAQILGAGPWASFWEVSFPALLPGVMSAASMAYITSYSQYFLTLLIGGGKIKTFSIVMVPFIQNGDKTISAVYSMVFILSGFLVFLVFDKLGGKENVNEP